MQHSINDNNNIIYSVLMYSHLRNINNLFEIILLKYNVIEFFMIFKIMGHVYDINIQTATAFLSESFNMTERQRRNACLREARVLIIVRTERGIPYRQHNSFVKIID